MAFLKISPKIFNKKHHLTTRIRLAKMRTYLKNSGVCPGQIYYLMKVLLQIKFRLKKKVPSKNTI